MRCCLLILIYICSQSLSFGQLGGATSFQFLNLPPSARASALGGYYSMLRDDDISLGLANPASLNSAMNGQLAINHNFHIADINYGSVNYGLSLDSSIISVAVGAQYVSYGQFIRTDERDQVLGSFGASDYAANVSAAIDLDNKMSIGSTLKLFRSTLDSYQSSGMALDVGFQYQKPENRTAWSLVLRNIGWQFSSFSETKEGVPFNIQIGYVKELEHVPFKLLITMRDLQQWNLSQDLQSDDPIFINQSVEMKSSFASFTDNLFRHLVIGGEFVLGQKELVRVRFGYNHQRNQELKSSVFRSFSGFSFGFGLKLKRFRLDYGFGVYHLAGGVNNLSLTIDLINANKAF